MKMKSESELAQSCPTLCDPIDGSPPGSAIPGILQARTLEWAAISFSNSQQPHGLQPTGSSIHGIFQARVLEWGAIAFSVYMLEVYNIMFHNFKGYIYLELL